MVSIDFTNIMSDPDAGYLPEGSIYAMKDYWKNKVALEVKGWKQKKYLQIALLIWSTYRLGRRISEMIGKYPYEEGVYPGLRPCDFLTNKSLIRFHILKKGHVMRKTRQGKAKSEEKLARELRNKKPLIKVIAVDKVVYNVLLRFIKEYDIDHRERLFPFSRSSCDRYIKEAAIACKIKLPGEKVLKDGSLTNKQVGFHKLRHSFAINLIKKNPNNPGVLPMLQELLCHSSINVTKVYIQFGQEDKIEFLTQSFSPKSKDEELEVLEEESPSEGED